MKSLSLMAGLIAGAPRYRRDMREYASAHFHPNADDRDFAARWAADNPEQAKAILATMLRNRDQAAEFAAGGMPNLSLGMDVGLPAYIPIGELMANGDIAEGFFTTLVGSLNAVPFTPSYLGDRGLFHYDSATTTNITLEFDAQTNNLLPVVPARAPATQIDLARRTTENFDLLRIPAEVTIYPDEIAGVRGTGTSTLDTMDHRADQKLKKAVRQLRTTMEFHRVGAAMGILLDANGGVLVNYFNKLGISQPTYDVTFGTAGGSKWIKVAADILNMLEDALGGLDDALPAPISLEGRAFHEHFISQADVADAYRYFAVQSATLAAINPLRQDLRYQDFNHGGLIHRQYRGSAKNGPNNTQGGRFIADNEAQLIVDGVDGTYGAVFGPPQDIIGRANQNGQPIDVTMEVLPHNAGWEFKLQTNVLHWCARPSVAIQFWSSN